MVRHGIVPSFGAEDAIIDCQMVVTNDGEGHPLTVAKLTGYATATPE